MGRVGTLCAETWVPLATPGWEEAHGRPLRAGPHLSHPAPPVSWNWASSWKTGRSLNTVPFLQVLFWIFTFLGVENSQRQLGFMPTGLEVVRRVSRSKGGDGLGSGGAGGASPMPSRSRSWCQRQGASFTVDLEEGKGRSQKCKSSEKFPRDENLLLFKHG